ncbi:MAG: hypothetical protein WB471_10065 [Nocardioides sp.]
MRRSILLAGATAATAALVGCGGGETATSGSASIDLSHIHGLAIDPADDSRVLIATHTGLVAYRDDALSKVGDASTDLMGFSTGPDGQLLASGHPGPDEDGPAVLGVIVSTDGGRAWNPLALSGEADFHALDAWPGGMVGFDGSIRISTDGGTSWSQGATDVAAFDLAATGSAIVATTEEGPRVSTDGGLSFAAASPAPLLQLVDFTPEGRLIGVAPSGEVHASDDLAGWERVGSIFDGQLQALTTGGNGSVWVATTAGLQHSTDGGASFVTAVSW